MIQWHVSIAIIGYCFLYFKIKYVDTVTLQTNMIQSTFYAEQHQIKID